MRGATLNHVIGSALLSVVALSGPACERCERQACEAVQRPYRGQALAQGIAGVISGESDLVVNSCAACEWRDARIDVWATAMPVADGAEAERVVNAGPPRATIQAHHRYQQALAPGDYLACVLPGPCASFSLRAGEVASMNVRGIFGPTGLVFFPPDGGSRPERVFRIESPPPVVSLELEGSGYFAGGQTANIHVLEPVAGRGGLQFNMTARRGSRQLSVSVAQAQPWPPGSPFDVGFGPGNQNQISEEDSLTGRAVSRSGRLELTLTPDLRFTGSFDVMMEELAPGQSLGQGTMRPARGTVAGTWTFFCSTHGPGAFWSGDLDLKSTFCAGVARQAGIPSR